jgi:hypothetical protein
MLVHFEPRKKIFRMLDPQHNYGKAWHNRVATLLWAWLMGVQHNTVWSQSARHQGVWGQGLEEPVWEITRDMAAAGLGRTVRRELVKRDVGVNEDSLRRVGIMISETVLEGTGQHAHWRWKGMEEGLPQQLNGWDCGVFVVMMIACIVRGWTFRLLQVGGWQIRAWLLMAMLSDSSRRRTRQCTQCGAAIDWEVVTSAVVSKLRCQATAERKARCGLSKRCKKQVGLGVGEIAATQVTARRTENTTEAESLMKVDDDSGRKQDSMLDQSHLDKNASGVREPAVTEGAAGDRRGSGSRYSGESRWSCGEAKMNEVLRNGRSDDGALVRWETVSSISRSAVGESGTSCSQTSDRT